MALEGEARRRILTSLLTEASITARPFFERQGFVMLQEQMVKRRGVEMINYHMIKNIFSS